MKQNTGYATELEQAKNSVLTELNITPKNKNSEIENLNDQRNELLAKIKINPAAQDLYNTLAKYNLANKQHYEDAIGIPASYTVENQSQYKQVPEEDKKKLVSYARFVGVKPGKVPERFDTDYNNPNAYNPNNMEEAFKLREIETQIWKLNGGDKKKVQILPIKPLSNLIQHLSSLKLHLNRQVAL